MGYVFVNLGMKKLLLLLLIAPMLLNAQIGNIFPTEIADIILIGDGEFYDIPQGYAFQPMISKENSLNVYSINGSNRDYLFGSYGRGLIGGGYSVKGESGFFSGVLLDFSNSDFNLIFEVDEPDGSPTTITVPNDKFLYLLQYEMVNFDGSSSGFGVIPAQTDVILNSTNDYYYYDSNGDGTKDAIYDKNDDGVIDELDKFLELDYISAIEMDITSINNSLSFLEQSKFENLHFYPNPTSSLLALNSDKEYDIEVYDMAGNKVMALTGNSVNMEHLSTATYIVKATDKSNNEELTYRVVKN